MKKTLAALMMAASVLTMAAEPENLFPLPTLQVNRSLGEHAGKWHRTLFDKATVNAVMTVDAATGELNVERSGKAGYAQWRLILATPAAGVYTLDTVITVTGAGVIDVYAFDASGKGKLIYFKQPKDVTDAVLCDTFTIPEGTTSVRFGFGVANDAKAAFQMPRLFAGKLTPAELPVRDANKKQ